MKIRIGTRKSTLALAQTKLVENALKAAFPEDEYRRSFTSRQRETKILDKPLDAIGGKGVFIAEIERALTENEIDIAVHSANDFRLNLQKVRTSEQFRNVLTLLTFSSCAEVIPLRT